MLRGIDELNPAIVWRKKAAGVVGVGQYHRNVNVALGFGLWALTPSRD